MKVKILKPWIVRGRLAGPGTLVDLPTPIAQSGIERGLCRRADTKTGRETASTGCAAQAGNDEGKGD
ncbi:MAG TPA: hypothetical protein VJ417_15030 [Candidatus Glassbacteria bacterium]|nr:hypothetical protein [Candidatus Glassbacteria bacterium]